MRELSYVQALNEGLHQIMEADERVLLMGQGVNSPWYVGSSTKGLFARFGPDRVIDTPVCEDSTTGMAVGAAIAGMRPIVVHPRVDFALLAIEQIIGQASNWHYMSGGKVSVPMVAWLIVNRGGEQAAQHSQSLQACFAHIPGLKVVMPGTAYDAKGLLKASVDDDSPVVFLDDRWLYGEVGSVPEDAYSVPIGKACIRRVGTDVTVVASSYLVPQAEASAAELASLGISAEVIDLRTVNPIDAVTILDSVCKTGRLVVADGGWAQCGISAEVAALVAESTCVHSLRCPVSRVALSPCPAPMSGVLEKAYYHGAAEITRAARTLVSV